MLNIVPNTGQSLGQTRDDMRQNFTSINRGFSVDHVTFNALQNEGKHNRVTFPPQGADPVLVADEMALYTKLIGGNPALFLSDFNTASIVNFTSATKANTGTMTLPSGIIVKWGRNTTPVIPNEGQQTVNFTTPFPNAIYTIYATVSVVGGSPLNSAANDRYARIYNYDTTQFSVVTFILNVPRNYASQDYVWLAIGS